MSLVKAQVQKGRVALVTEYNNGQPITVVDLSAPAAITGYAYTQAALLFDASGAPLVWRDDGSEKVMPTMGKILDPSGTPIGDIANPIVVTDASSTQAASIVTADFYREITVADNNFVAIDLDNAAGAGPYKHDYTKPGLKIAHLGAYIQKDDVIDQWEAKFGVVTRIDASDADIVWLQDGILRLFDTATFEARNEVRRPNSLLDLTVTAGALVDVAPSFITLNDTAVNTATPLKNIADSDVTPAVGDIILRVARTFGTDKARVHYQFGYFAG